MGCGSSTAASDPSYNRPGQKSVFQTNGHLPESTSVYKKPEIEHIELTEEVVREYVSLEKDIHKLERKNVIKVYESKAAHAAEIKKTVDQLEITLKELKKLTAKEKADVESLSEPSVSAFLKQQGTYDAKWDKEQKEYLDALSQQECAEKELAHTKQNYENSVKIEEAYKERAMKLTELYARQDKILTGIFGGEYGSELENKLESQLDDGLEWQQRVALARFKWTNSRVLLVHGCTQMAFGVKRWGDLPDIDPKNTRMRYFAAAEARNNFIAAGQNIQSVRVYLGKVQFPYCTEEQMQKMEQSIHSAFTDIQENNTYESSLKVYKDVHRNVASLIQWFDQVSNEQIQKMEQSIHSAFTDIQENNTYESSLKVYKDVHRNVASLIQWFDQVSKDQMQKMEQSIHSAFTDIQENNTYESSLKVYKDVHRNVASLIQWFDQVSKEQMQNMEQCIHSAFTDIQENNTYESSLKVYKDVDRNVASLIEMV